MGRPWNERTILLLGDEKVERLHRAHILVVGVGGVGAYAAEMLTRAGVGRITLVDADAIQPSNINRQLPATHQTIGMPKVEVMRERLMAINPTLKLETRCEFLDETTIEPFLAATPYSFIIDAIDSITPKAELIATALRMKVKIVSSMGAGAKDDPTAVTTSVLSKTFNCGLAKAMRTRLKAMGVRGKLPVVFSTQPARKESIILIEGERNKKSTSGTISYMPAIFGCHLAAYAIKQL